LFSSDEKEIAKRIWEYTKKDLVFANFETNASIDASFLEAIRLQNSLFECRPMRYEEAPKAGPFSMKPEKWRMRFSMCESGKVKTQTYAARIDRDHALYNTSLKNNIVSIVSIGDVKQRLGISPETVFQQLSPKLPPKWHAIFIRDNGIDIGHHYTKK